VVFRAWACQAYTYSGLAKEKTGRKKLVKSLPISTIDKVIYYIGTFLQGSTKPLITTQTTCAFYI
jgi:hypothetical protein